MNELRLKTLFQYVGGFTKNYLHRYLLNSFRQPGLDVTRTHSMTKLERGRLERGEKAQKGHTPWWHLNVFRSQYLASLEDWTQRTFNGGGGVPEPEGSSLEELLESRRPWLPWVPKSVVPWVTGESFPGVEIIFLLAVPTWLPPTV